MLPFSICNLQAGCFTFSNNKHVHALKKRQPLIAPAKLFCLAL
jgi:hypothetical protein